MATDYKLRISAKDNTKKGFSGVDKNISKTQGAMKKLAGAFAGVFAVRAIVQFGAETLEVADNIGKTADAIGVTTGFLQKYQFAAQQSGVETEQFNKALKFFSKGVGEATMGTGLAKQAFEEMGISLKDSSGETKKSEALFKEFFVSLDSIQEPFKRNALLAQVFGAKVGITMANLVKGGSDAMNDLAESATGVITEESIRKAEAFNDTMNRLKRQVLLPLQEAFISTSTAILNFAETMGLIKPDLFTKSTEELTNKLNEQKDTLKVLETTQAGLNKTNFRGLQVVAVSIKKTKEEISVLETAVGAREKQAEIQKKLNAQLTNPAPLAEFSKNIKENITVVQQFADTIEGRLTSAFKNFFDFASAEFLSFKELATSIAQAVINELINVFIVKKLVGFISSGVTDYFDPSTAKATALTDSISFAGGGYTGMGARAGGVDGKGGFPAVLHPNETVVDHEQGQSQSSPTINFNINAVDAAGFDQLLQSRKGLITSIINNAMNNQGKMGVI